jgi:hypothetical protein
MCFGRTGTNEGICKGGMKSSGRITLPRAVQVFTVRNRIRIQANPDVAPLTDLPVFPELLPGFRTWHI